MNDQGVTFAAHGDDDDDKDGTNQICAHQRKHSQWTAMQMMWAQELLNQ